MKKPARRHRAAASRPVLGPVARLRQTMQTAAADVVSTVQGMSPRQAADALRALAAETNPPAFDAGAWLADNAAGVELSKRLPPACRFPPLLTPDGVAARKIEPEGLAWKIAGEVMASPATELARLMGSKGDRGRLVEALAAHVANAHRELARAQAAEARAIAVLSFVDMIEAGQPDPATVERVAQAFDAAWQPAAPSRAVSLVTPAPALTINEGTPDACRLPAEGQPWGAAWAALPDGLRALVLDAGETLGPLGTLPDAFPLDDPAAWPRFADGVAPVPVHVRTLETLGWAVPLPAGSGWGFVRWGLLSQIEE